MPAERRCAVLRVVSSVCEPESQLVLLMLSLALLALAYDDCPLLAEDPFRPRGVRKQDNEWTADIFLTRCHEVNRRSHLGRQRYGMLTIGPWA